MTKYRDPAPHGVDEDGTPLAPYGTNVDGSPRKSNRGARAGQRGNTGGSTPRVKTSNATDAKRRDTLCGLVDMFIVTPLAGLSTSPWVAARLGPKQADALAGDAVILSHFSPAAADAVIVLSQSKPGALAWLDTVEDKAPWVMLLQITGQITKALGQNHISPDPRLAEAGRTLMQIRMAQMAQAIQDEATAMGIDVAGFAQTQAPEAEAA